MRTLPWFGVLGAPAAWALQEWSGWYLASAPCRPQGLAHALTGASRAWQGGINLLLLAVAAAALLSALHARRRVRAAPGSTQQADAFLARVGIIVSALGLLAIAWGSLGTLVLPACEAMR